MTTLAELRRRAYGGPAGTTAVRLASDSEGTDYAVLSPQAYDDTYGLTDWRVQRGLIVHEAVSAIYEIPRNKLTGEGRAAFQKDLQRFSEGAVIVPTAQARAFAASRLKPFWRFTAGSTGWGQPAEPSTDETPPNQIELNLTAATRYMRGFCGEVCQELISHHAPNFENRNRAKEHIEARYKKESARVGPSDPNRRARLANIKKQRGDDIAKVNALPDAISKAALDELSFADLVGLPTAFNAVTDEASLMNAVAAAMGTDPARLNNYGQPDPFHIAGLHSSVWDSPEDLAEARRRDYAARRELADELSGHTAHTFGLAHLKGMTKGAGGAAYLTRAERDAAVAAAQESEESQG